MSRRPALVTKTDLRMAVAAAATAPSPMAVRIDKAGNILILPVNGKLDQSSLKAPFVLPQDNADEKEPDL